MESIELYLQRLWSDKEQTFGFLRDTKREFKSWILEDEWRNINQKVKGETRILSGRYPLGIRAEDTPLTIKHRETYNKAFKDKQGNNIEWFKYHIEILKLLNFSGVYFHSGVDQTHTDGCILMADRCDLTLSVNPLSASLTAVKRFYDFVYPKLEAGIPVFINIKDEIELF